MIALNELAEIDQLVFRNIQCVRQNFDEFDDLTNDPATKRFAHQLVNNKINANKNEYNAISFIFAQQSWLPSRFSNGSYPVWYGTAQLETSFYETLYHWKKRFIDAPQGFDSAKNQPIKTSRTVFTVNCHAALIDLRTKATQENKLIHPDPSSYFYTQKLGERIQKEGHPGLITRSARIITGENIVIFKKNILSNAEHYHDYVYEYNSIIKETVVKESGSRKTVLTLNSSME